MATTTNFGWETPDDTDLVKDGAAAIRTALGGVDTSFVDLKGGTTGQVLSKASNTDLDYTWVTTDDANAIQNAIVDAKGDLIAASAADTPARLAVGNNGETLVADSSTATGLRYTAGTVQDNPIINSAMQVWQRGTSISVAASTNAYTADRWQTITGANQACTISRQATGDTTNLPFIQYALRYQRNSGQTGTGILTIAQSIETINSVPFAGKAITMSFYARAGANYSATGSILGVVLQQGNGTDLNVFSGFGAGGTIVSQNATLTTTWQRFSYNATMSATSTQLAPYFNFAPTGTAGAADYFEITGVQIDIGSVALPFRTNGGTIQGELAACQRYYTTSIPTGYTITDFPIMGTTGAGGVIFTCSSGSTNDLFGTIQYPATLRSTPTINIYSGNNRTSGSVRDMVTGTDATVSAYSAQTGQNKNFTYMGVGTFTNSRQYGFHYTASAEL